MQRIAACPVLAGVVRKDEDKVLGAVTHGHLQGQLQPSTMRLDE